MASTQGRTIECRAAVAWAPKQPLSIETIEVAPPKAGEVRVRLHFASICLTDNTLLSGISVGYPKPLFPIILGHECAGVVESVGEGVTLFQSGDSVLVCCLPQCRKCKLCKIPSTAACESAFINIVDGSIGFGDDKSTRFSFKGKSIYHFAGVSSFSEYTVVRDSHLIRVDPHVPLDRIASMSCGFLAGFGAAVNIAGITKGSICAIWGLGTVGLAAILGCKRKEPACIIAIDKNPEKFPLALKFGATHCINPDDPSIGSVEEAIAKLTKGEGVDFALECVGSNSLIRQALETTNKYSGKAVIVGGAPETEEIILSNSLQFLFGRTLIGSWMGGIKTLDHLNYLVQEYLAGRLPIDDFLTHRVDLANINDGFDYLRNGKCVKTVINLL